MEKILEINDCSFKIKGKYSEFDGYEIKTDRQIIQLGISNSQSCCENWGYLMSEDDIKEFIGSDLLSISITSTELNQKVIDVLKEEFYEGDTMFVNIVTSKGVLQFVAYNSHNGYYGHDMVVLSEQLNYDL